MYKYTNNLQRKIILEEHFAFNKAWNWEYTDSLTNIPVVWQIEDIEQDDYKRKAKLFKEHVLGITKCLY